MSSVPTGLGSRTEREAREAPGEVRPAAVLEGVLRLPSDKSIAHRALLFSALAEGEATISFERAGADVRSTLGALMTLGAVRTVDEGDAGALVVRIVGGGDAQRARLPGRGGERIDCGNSGTTMRLLLGALAGRPGEAELGGDASLSRRPMERVAAPLRAMGASVRTTAGHAPVHVRGALALRALDHALPVASAQVLGSITLAALAASGTTRIETPAPTRDHTERLLGWLGAPVRRDGLVTTVEGPGRLAARDVSVPGDLSSAAAWLVAGALHPRGELVLEGVGLNPSRLGIVEVLREMGAHIELEPTAGGDEAPGPEPQGTIRVRGGRALRAIELDGPRVADLIDELPLLGVAMAGAAGASEVRGAAELRVKESDRIALVTSGLAAIGAEVEELPDGWRVRAGRPRDSEIRTGGDHRIAMAFAVAALTGVAGSVRIDDPACVAISYPGFWADLAAVTS